MKRLTPAAVMPKYAKQNDSGLDLCASVDIQIEPGESRLVLTGIAIELPAGMEAQVRPRSGLAREHSITVLNTPGTIDEGYRGEIGVILINHGRRRFEVTSGMRIAQLVVQPRFEVDVVEADALTVTDRGPGGFGSTGK